MTPDQIDCLELDPAIKKTFDVPQIIQFREQGEAAESRFQEVRAEIRTSKDVHLNFVPFPNAQEGVRRLNEEFGGVHYYTVRPREVINPTVQWLESQGFPSPQEVVICTSARDKVFKMVRDWTLARGDSGVNVMTDERRVVVVDDNFAAMIFEAEKLAARYSVMRRALSGLTVVVFGIDEKEKEIVLEENMLSDYVRSHALSSWDPAAVEDLIGKLKK